MGNKNKKKLLFFVEAMGGGVYTYIVDLSNALIDIYDIYIAYAVRPQTPNNYKEYFDPRIHLIKVKNFTREVPSTKDIKAYFEIKKIAKYVQPDLIHLHSAKAGVLGRLAFNGKKTSLFYTPHGYSFLMRDQGKIKRAIYKAIEFLCAKRKCTTICCSKGEYLETLRLTKNATYVNNGININEIEEILSTVKPEEEKGFTVYTAGRICAQKGPELFNEIAKSLPDVRFLWIGDGELRNVLTASNIEVTGWLGRTEVLSKAASADVFLLTSLWEGLPMSLLEAMYMRKPCIVSDVIGNHDVIRNGINGFVCKSMQKFKQTIQKVINNKDDKIVNQAYLDIQQKYNTRIMARQYAHIYQKALKIERGGVISNNYFRKPVFIAKAVA